MTAAFIEAIIAVFPGADLIWVEIAAGALRPPCLWRRFIYTVPSPPCEGSVNCAGRERRGRPAQDAVGLAGDGLAKKVVE